MTVNHTDYLITSILLYRIINISKMQRVYFHIMITLFNAINQLILHFIFLNIIYYYFFVLMLVKKIILLATKQLNKL